MLKRLTTWTLFLLFCFPSFLLSMEPFTARVKSNRVRLRAEPHTNSFVIREVNKGDLFVVVDENDEFLVVLPPKWMKAYVYRSFVIDDVIEGNKVNVRIAPTLEAPIIAQLNSGDKVEGTVSTQNNRWLKIKTPDSTRFYISKGLLEKIGPPEYIETLEKKQQEVDFLLLSAQKMGNEELAKSFDDIQLEETYGYLDKVIQDYLEFPNQVYQAKKLIQEYQQAYLQKKIAHLEERAKKIAETLQTTSPQINEEIRIHQQQLSDVEKSLPNEPLIAEEVPSEIEIVEEPISRGITPRMAAWYPQEEQLILQWITLKNDDSLTNEDFYQEEKQHSLTLTGVVEPYQKAVKNKPGDYILVHKSNQMPIAYLYSTRVDLHDYLGKEVSLVLSKRPNNNFAFQAFYVLDVE